MHTLFRFMVSTRQSRRQAALLGLVLSLFTVFAHAQDSEVRQVELLAASCANCHGTDGRLETAIPAIANRSVRVLEAQLLAFKYDDQPQVTVMDRIAKGYSEAQLQALAEYFATID